MSLTVHRISVILAFIILSSLHNCSQNNQDILKEEKKFREPSAGILLGKYFGINAGAEDDFHVFQFNLYLTSDNKITGTYRHIDALFDPISDAIILDHINNRKLIEPDIFKSVLHHIGHIINGIKQDSIIYFKTDIRKYDNNYELQWEFRGRIDKSYLKGELTEFYKYIHVSGERYAYTTKKLITFKEISRP